MSFPVRSNKVNTWYRKNIATTSSKWSRSNQSYGSGDGLVFLADILAIYGLFLSRKDYYFSFSLFYMINSRNMFSWLWQSGIGTDATMHDHIKKLLDRCYAVKDANTRFSPTKLVRVSSLDDVQNPLFWIHFICRAGISLWKRASPWDWSWEFMIETKSAEQALKRISHFP